MTVIAVFVLSVLVVTAGMGVGNIVYHLIGDRIVTRRLAIMFSGIAAGAATLLLFLLAKQVVA